jgi:hypothetical protein
VLDFPGDHVPVALTSLAPGARAGLIVASSPEHVAVSSDGGQSFATPLVPTGQTAATLVGDTVAGPVVLVASTVRAGPQESSIISRSTDAGATLRPLGSNLPLGTSVRALVQLSDGRLIAGVVSTEIGDEFGVRCSQDGGGTWSDHC